MSMSMLAAIKPVGRISDSVIRRYAAEMADYGLGLSPPYGLFDTDKRSKELDAAEFRPKAKSR